MPRAALCFSVAALACAALLPMRAAPQTSPDAVPAALAAQGRAVFYDTCVVCHGEDGRGGHGGGPPLDQAKDAALVIATVADGRGQMPALGGMLTPEQIRAVAAFVVNDLFK
jgi:mono/diheme cytochrome c family protein